MDHSIKNNFINENHNTKEWEQHNPSLPELQTSMSTLIIWNISKAIEKNPRIDLKSAIKAAQERLESNPHDVASIISQHSDERHLACALLAWQHLGHKNADSLCRFVETRQNEERCGCSKERSDKDLDSLFGSDLIAKPSSFIKYKQAEYSKGIVSNNFDVHSLIGPVMNLPVMRNDTKIVMRVDNTQKTPSRRSKPRDKDITTKIDEACCLESGCVERLAALDASTGELRTRAAKLAQREAERAELLERAEAAWKDLELGYQRRLTLAEEKEDDITRQTKKLIDERNGYKRVCLTLVQQMKEKGSAAEKARQNLTVIEKEVCDRACVRLRLSEESAREDAILADYQCKAAQLDRDIQFKEEQARRKVQGLESELDSARALIYEAERAMRSELNALKDQVAQISQQLLAEDAENSQLFMQLEGLLKEKMGLIEDLDGCKVICDKRMQNKSEELKKKREQLAVLKAKVVACQCKLPMEASVEAKRTPSLAALCKCSPEDRLLDTCSCTSLRSSLLSNMLADLFNGLQSELGCTGCQMPCQLLKCLEDKHNWDRATIVKTNLRNYFSKLLVGELDIAIATSIEKYHARWIGASCVDNVKLVRNKGESENEGWQQRALERRAQTLATDLAEKMFKEKHDEIMQNAKDVVTSGPPPCECSSKQHTALYRCLLDQPQPLHDAGSVSPHSTGSPDSWKRTHNDVTLLRAQIEELKKVSVRKEDLKFIENKITKLIQRSSVTDKEVPTSARDMSLKAESSKRDRSVGPFSVDRLKPNANYNKLNLVKKKQSNVNGYPKNINKNPLNQTDKQLSKNYKRPGQSFAVNMCLCGVNKDPNKIPPQAKLIQSVLNEPDKITTIPKILSREISSIKQTKPIASLPQGNETSKNSKTSTQQSCQSNCVCFHKIPSNTSIDKLLKTLTRWKCDLTDSLEKKFKNGTIIQQAGLPDDDDIKHQDGTNSKPKIGSNITTSDGTAFSYNLSGQIEETIEFSHQVPAITDSEYIGTINLDKSNEKTCKCGIDQNFNSTFKCIDFCVCCNKSCEIEEKKTSAHFVPKIEIQFKKEDIGTLICHNQDQEQSKGDFQNTIFTGINILENTLKSGSDNVTSDRNEVVDSNHDESVINYTGMKNTSNVDTVRKKCDLSPCDSDYRVKFLGVTLTDTLSNSNGSKICKENNYYDVKSKKPHHIKDHNNFGASHNQLPTCQCNVNFDAFKHFFDNTLQFGDHNINVDKSLDTRSLKTEHVIEQEPCVCCKTHDSKESCDLEINTFQLLEQHLKEKLLKFKLNCQSSCISPDEEDKLYSTIASKIKQIIIQNISQIGCKCSDKFKYDESWHRAFSLLQEYLKAKIKRVQCLCEKENDKHILPDVTHKICNLIENDFEKLKNHCKCKNIDILSKRKNNSNQLLDQYPEKDKTNSEKVEFIIMPEVIKSDYVSNIQNIPNQNISSQVSNIMGMNSKSCEAVKTDIQELKTVDTRNSATMCSESKCCQCHNRMSIEFNLPHQIKETLINHGTDALKTDDPVYLVNVGKTNILLHEGNENTEHSPQEIDSKKFIVDDQQKTTLNESTKLTKEFIETNNLHYPEIVFPYIGYTVDCSCDYNIGHCVCSKSIVQENNKQINEFWKSLENSNSNKENVSYIMDNVHKKRDDLMNYIEIADDSYVQNMPISNYTRALTTCDTMASVHDDREIVLKDSKNKCQSPKNTTTNTFEDDLLSYRTDYTTEDPLEWYDCGSQLADERASKTVRFNNLKQAKSDALVNNTTEKSSKISSDCACNMVPICHVKMLMNNIENKLVNSECTCDSLSSKVCPVHSKRSMY